MLCLCSVLGVFGFVFLFVVFLERSGQLSLTYHRLKPAKFAQSLQSVSFKLEVAIFILPVPLLSFGWTVAELES